MSSDRLHLPCQSNYQIFPSSLGNQLGLTCYKTRAVQIASFNTIRSSRAGRYATKLWVTMNATIYMGKPWETIPIAYDTTTIVPDIPALELALLYSAIQSRLRFFSNCVILKQRPDWGNPSGWGTSHLATGFESWQQEKITTTAKPCI
jgi:hypothetical protein